MHRFRFSTIFLTLLALLITSCGGETVDGITSIPDEIDGLWSGSVMIDDQIAQSIYMGLSDSEGNLNIILDPSGNASLAGLALFFNGEIDSISSGLTLYNEPGDFVDDLTFELGTFNPDPPVPSLSATLINGTKTTEVKLELTYNATLYETPSSLALVSGTWRYSDGVNTLDLEIDSNGIITAGEDNDGCLYTGHIGILKSERNLYRISVEITCPHVPTTISTTGLATLTEVFFQDTLIYSVTGIDTTRSESVAFVERLTRQ